jgi:hypothetical protein
VAEIPRFQIARTKMTAVFLKVMNQRKTKWLGICGGMPGHTLTAKCRSDFIGAPRKRPPSRGAAAKALRLGRSGHQKRFCSDTP